MGSLWSAAILGNIEFAFIFYHLFYARQLLAFLALWIPYGICDEYKLHDDILLSENNDGFSWDLVLTGEGEREIIASLGHNVGATKSAPIETTDGLFIRQGDVHLNISIEGDKKEKHLVVTWTAPKDRVLTDCVFLGKHHWYGGPQQKHQYWPIEKLTLKDYSYIPKEADNAAITEPYWLSSHGFFIHVDPVVPLFVDQNNALNDTTCFVADVRPPYSHDRPTNVLKYRVGHFRRDPRRAHMHVVRTIMGKPRGIPDARMIRDPIWSTWAEYKADINETIVVEFAQRIVDNNFTNSQLEIDDLWEMCYGSLEVDTTRFPDMKAMNLRLKEMGFRITIWIHPFINEGCEPAYTEALTKGYLVKNETGDVRTSWWNSKGPTAAYVDFTNPEATKWWTAKLDKLRENYAIDSFKFDAGETSWSPPLPVQNGDILHNPAHITRDYVRACAKYGPMVEVRTGYGTQDLPIFVRMIDKDSEWNFENGLPTLVTTLLQMNMNGYPLVLPDMIGGNGYNGSPSKELFIRWLQANVFMPSLQYSYVPWDYDDETIAISRKFTDLHIKYTDHILHALMKSADLGEPANPPIWWVDPRDKIALGVWDEFMLGDKILVAPVMDKGKTSRDVYLPKGKWKAEDNHDRIYKGPTFIKDYPAPLDTLPFFVRA